MYDTNESCKLKGHGDKSHVWNKCMKYMYGVIWLNWMYEINVWNKCMT